MNHLDPQIVNSLCRNHIWYNSGMPRFRRAWEGKYNSHRFYAFTYRGACIKMRRNYFRAKHEARRIVV